MTDLNRYISRKPAQDFLVKFIESLEQPELAPLIFHIYGFGGVGKTTLLERLKSTCNQQVDIAEVSFGCTPNIETPLKLMSKLYEQLPQLPSLLERDLENLFVQDPFTTLYERYQQTLYKIRTQPVTGKSIDEKQENTLKDWFELGSYTVLAIAASTYNPGAAAGVAFDGLAKAGGMLSSAAERSTDVKERIQKLLREHPATKNHPELQSLILDPLPQLSKAFVHGLAQRSEQQRRGIVLILDTYEKVIPDIDIWLRQYLLNDTCIKAHPIRIVVAGRRTLLEKESWRKLQQDRNLIYERRLDEFDKEQTTVYLQGIGITKPQEIQKIYRLTKGLPYYLNWIREVKEKGEEIDFSRGNQAIAELLLQGLSLKQKQIVQLAACCRWFDRSLIQFLLKRQGIEFETGFEASIDCFTWLTQCDFVKLIQGHYRLDDVAREVFRLAFYQEDKNQFRRTHELLADYFEKQANQEVSSDSTPPEKYNNSDWREYTSESLYHFLFAKSSESRRRFLSHLFAGAYLKQADTAKVPFLLIAAESEIETYELLPGDTRKFLKSLEFTVTFGWLVLDQAPNSYEFELENFGSLKPQIEKSIDVCLKYLDSLDGLARYIGLLCKSLRCYSNRQVELLLEAREQAESLVTNADPEFSSSLFWRVGALLNEFGRYQESLNSCDRALKIQPNNPIALANQGAALGNLDRHEEALSSFGKALEIQPNYPLGWVNQGIALSELEHYQEAVTSFRKALELQPNYSSACIQLGDTLVRLNQFEEALVSYDKFLELQPDDASVRYGRGIVLSRLGRSKEALNSFEEVLELQNGDPSFWDSQGVALRRLGRHQEALVSHNKALEIQPNYSTALANRGSIFACLGDYKKAHTDFKEALSIQPNDPSIFYAMAYCHLLQGDIDSAINKLQRAIDLNPIECRAEAKNNNDFETIKGDHRFQTLVQE